ncbi:hypothetical protein Scep_018231 [Stephania cephalantha]|uniref:HMA domain-containing protein n=1 Tax=Stephania cephalantha TaxID=152367 RepID=A0AAP0ISE5_9MAGN
MGEEVEKDESNKKSEEEQKDTEESKAAAAAAAAPLPPPPQEIVLRVYMHCEGCAKKVRKCLKGLQGVEEVETDCKAHKVIVKGEKADPLKVLGVLQRKCNRQVELVSPIPKPKTEEENKIEETKENVKPEEKKPEIITAVVRVHMHCDACAQKIQKCILKMEGVESASVDMKSSEATVKGGFEASKLVEYLYKKTGKHAAIVKTEAEEKKNKEEKVENEEEKTKSEVEQKQEEKKKKKSSNEQEEELLAKGEEGAKTEKEETKVVAEVLKAHELYHHPIQYLNQFNADPPYHHPIQFNTEYVYPPQMFSDENPNACSVM